MLLIGNMNIVASGRHRRRRRRRRRSHDPYVSTLLRRRHKSEYDQEKNTITHCRPTQGTAKTSQRTITVTSPKEVN